MAIKAVGDFPNFVYLLGYDEFIIRKSLDYDGLNNQNSLDSKKYLEKIVQFTVPVPMIDKTSLNEYTYKKLDIIFKDTYDKLYDKSRLNNIYWDVIKYYLSTPRSIISLYNSLQLIYPPVRNEVNVVDFILIEVLRQNHPEIYNFIKDNNNYFIINNKYNYPMPDDSIEQEERKKLIGKLYENSYIPLIIDDLFPHIRGTQTTPDISSKSNHKNEQSLRIFQDYQTFKKYFRYQIEDVLSSNDIRSFIQSLSSPEDFLEGIKKLSETYVAQYFTAISKGLIESEMKKSDQYIDVFKYMLQWLDEDTSKENLQSVVRGCLKLEHDIFIKIFDDKSTSLFRQSRRDYIEATVYRAIKLYPQKERLQLLKEAFLKALVYAHSFLTRVYKERLIRF